MKDGAEMKKSIKYTAEGIGIIILLVLIIRFVPLPSHFNCADSEETGFICDTVATVSIPTTAYHNTRHPVMSMLGGPAVIQQYYWRKNGSTFSFKFMEDYGRGNLYTDVVNIKIKSDNAALNLPAHAFLECERLNITTDPYKSHRTYRSISIERENIIIRIEYTAGKLNGEPFPADLTTFDDLFHGCS